MGSSLVRFAATAATLFSLCVPVLAQKADSDTPIDTVFAFNRICYTQVPATQGIENMAFQLGWKPLDNDDMIAFGSPENFDYFRGWDVQLGEVFYRLGLTQSKVAASMAKTFPAFANGKTTSCSLVIGDEQPQEAIAENMQALVGKVPVSSGVDEGSVKTTTWAGGNNDFKIFLFNKVSNTGAGGILNVTVISKE